MTLLKTVDDVIDALGGTSAVAKITGRKPQHVSNWRSDKRIPADTYLYLKHRLSMQRMSASSLLWGITPVRARAVKKQRARAR